MKLQRNLIQLHFLLNTYFPCPSFSIFTRQNSNPQSTQYWNMGITTPKRLRSTGESGRTEVSATPDSEPAAFTPTEQRFSLSLETIENSPKCLPPLCSTDSLLSHQTAFLLLSQWKEDLVLGNVQLIIISLGYNFLPFSQHKMFI